MRCSAYPYKPLHRLFLFMAHPVPLEARNWFARQNIQRALLLVGGSGLPVLVGARFVAVCGVKEIVLVHTQQSTAVAETVESYWQTAARKSTASS